MLRRLLSGRGGRTRTCDPLLRRQMLYPPELRPHVENDACDGTVPPASSAFFSLVEQPPHSMVSRRSRASTFSCADTYTFLTTPVTGAYTVDCIFIASITSNRSPFWMRCPDLMCRIVIAPGIGAPTSPGLPGSALTRALAAALRDLSRISTSRGCPFSSKNTVRKPSG